jgi:hypothetical protein
MVGQNRKHLRIQALMCALMILLQTFSGLGQPGSATFARSQKEVQKERDGQRDFDFNIGTWKTNVRRLLHPLSGSTTWTEYEGVSVVSKVWNGRASLLELKVDGPAGHIEGVGLRLYNAKSRQWNLNWANSADGTITKPMIGEFKAGRGEFFNQETFNGRAIFVRNGFSDITANSSRFEQAFSDDGGKTWETNWIMTFTRAKAQSDKAVSDLSTREFRQPGKAQDGQHDFDFEIGTWKTHLRRLVRPLSSSSTWVEYDGVSVVRKIWNGRANLVELVADGPAGHFEGLNLRLYNPQSRQWSLNFANINSGELSQPTIGGFKNGRGEFYDQETFNGRAILVRFVISDITPDSCRFEQSFSDDGGKNWELNWIAIDTRIKD